MIKIASVSMPLDYTHDMIMDFISAKLRIPKDRISSFTICKKAVDTRDKTDIKFMLSILCDIRDEGKVLIKKKDQSVSIHAPISYSVPNASLTSRPVIVGSGPAGLFAALILAQSGTKPIVIDRGQDIELRQKSVDAFWRTGNLNTESNVQFGEGGAGTFSDGKLKPGLLDKRKFKVLSEFARFGAPPEIMYLAKPHIGTDNLHHVIKNIRNEIISLGGEFRFSSKLTGITIKNAQMKNIIVEKNGVAYDIAAENLILAIGHSARDTMQMLYSAGIPMVQKSFAVGVRIEHPQEIINKAQYGTFSNHKSLGAADYRLVEHIPNGRSVYSFCMCPGGQVVAATSENGHVVTNGMSQYTRDGSNANSAMLVSLTQKDYKSTHPLAGISLQEEIEKSAYISGGGNYHAPVQLLDDFVNNRPSTSFRNIFPTYLPGTTFAKVESYLPKNISDSLRYAVKKMFLWMPEYNNPDAIITGAETRTTSPVQIIRTESLISPVAEGLYPCGEGAGYSGGIISSAVDGIKCAEAILAKYPI